MILRAVPLLGILLVNLIPLAGVLWFGWSVFEVLLLYWFENVAIGAAHAARMEISTRTNKGDSGRSTTVFFMLHYGLFTFVHGIFVVVFFGVLAGGLSEISEGFLAPVIAILAWQILFLILDAIRTEGFKGRTPDDLMFEPYPRVLALHITVLAGGWLVGEIGSPISALVILVGIKAAFDLGIAWATSPPARNSTGVFGALRIKRD